MSRSGFHHGGGNNKLKRSRDGAVCFDFQKGSCARDNCKFLHADPSMVAAGINSAESSANSSRGEGGGVDGKSKRSRDTTAICFDFQKGCCTRENCRFFHPPADGDSSSNSNSGSSSSSSKPQEGRIEYSSNSEDRHKGSFSLEDIKKSEEYARRNVITDGIKRKYAICFGYLGSNYAGLQINPGIISIEAYLEKALLLSGAIIESNFGNLQKIQWSRAARTDRGVHAVGQCIAAKISVPAIGKESALVELLNSFLPSDIRVFTMTKVAKSFNAKNYCAKRIYQYLLPTYTLANYAEINAELDGVAGATRTEPCDITSESMRQLRLQKKSYRTDPTTIKKFRDALQPFVGTHSFHNFTSGLFPGDSQSKRYIISFDCSDPFVDSVHGTEWVMISIFGQSFLLNQIRRMVAMAIEVARGACDVETIHRAFSPKKVDVPMVPGLGLYLNELFFDIYNIRVERKFDPSLANKNKSDDREMVLDFSANADVVSTAAGGGPDKDDKDDEDDKDDKDEKSGNEQLLWHSSPDNLAKFQSFKDDFIWRHIFEEDEKTMAFLAYLDHLRVHPYSYESKDFMKLTSGGSRSSKSRNNYDGEE